MFDGLSFLPQVCWEPKHENMHELGVPEERIENDWDNGFMCDVHLELVTGLHYEQLGPFIIMPENWGH